MNTAEDVFILVGADVIFNHGKLTKKIITFFHDVLKIHYDNKNVVCVISQKELVDACFGC